MMTNRVFESFTFPTLKWYWQVLEDKADVKDFGCISQTREMTMAISAAESDYATRMTIATRMTPSPPGMTSWMHPSHLKGGTLSSFSKTKLPLALLLK